MCLRTLGNLRTQDQKVQSALITNWKQELKNQVMKYSLCSLSLFLSLSLHIASFIAFSMALIFSILASTWLIHEPSPQLYITSHITLSLESNSKFSEDRILLTNLNHMFTEFSDYLMDRWFLQWSLPSEKKGMGRYWTEYGSMEDIIKRGNNWTSFVVWNTAKPMGTISEN